MRDADANELQSTPCVIPRGLDCRRMDACSIVTDSVGQKLAYVYFEDEPGRRFGGEIIDPR
jgi:hypothetical protein